MTKERELALETALRIVELWLLNLRDYTQVGPEHAASKKELLQIVKDALDKRP